MHCLWCIAYGVPMVRRQAMTPASIPDPIYGSDDAWLRPWLHDLWGMGPDEGERLSNRADCCQSSSVSNVVSVRLSADRGVDGAHLEHTGPCPCHDDRELRCSLFGEGITGLSFPVCLAPYNRPLTHPGRAFQNSETTSCLLGSRLAKGLRCYLGAMPEPLATSAGIPAR